MPKGIVTWENITPTKLFTYYDYTLNGQCKNSV